MLAELSIEDSRFRRDHVLERITRAGQPRQRTVGPIRPPMVLGRGMAKAGLILGYLSMAVWLLVLLVVLSAA